MIYLVATSSKIMKVLGFLTIGSWILRLARSWCMSYELMRLQIQKATFKLDKACVLDSFRRHIDLEAIFWFLVQKQK